MSVSEEKNIPQQNPPMNSNNPFSYISLWIIGGLMTIIVGGFGYLLNRLDNRIDNGENKQQLDHNNLESKYSIDHDKIIKLETIIDTLKK